MTHQFDRNYWEQHWQQRHQHQPRSRARPVANPYLARETSGLVPGTALDAGCGVGAEAIWLAARGWHVTAADISASALARAAEDAVRDGVAERVEWVEADLGVWEPGAPFDLVTTHYAHPAMPQLAFYDRIARWVAPGGTLLIVGHLHTEPVGHGHGDQPPAEASVTVPDVTAALERSGWEIVTAEEHVRTVAEHGNQAAPLHDVVVRATRGTQPNRPQPVEAAERGS